MKSPVYIAGKVTGTDPQKCATKFHQKQRQLQALGHQVINPLEVVGHWHTPWPDAMRQCLAALMEARSLYALPCWQTSNGARLEVYIAQRLGLEIHGCPHARYPLVLP
jgi:hypothetical protein